MNDSDPIVDEVRRIRDAHAARFNYDLRAIFEDIKEQQRRSGLRFVSFGRDGSVLPPAREVGLEPSKASPSTKSAQAEPDTISSRQASQGADL